MQRPIIDPEFKKLIPPLRKEERDRLEANILRDGILDSLKVWRGTWILLDGHNRLEIAEAHGLEYSIEEIDCASRQEAEQWIDLNTLGRRNLTKDQFDYIMGRVYNRRKKAQGGRADRDLSGDQNEHPKTADLVAAEFGVSPATVKRNAKKILLELWKAGRYPEAIPIPREKPTLRKFHLPWSHALRYCAKFYDFTKDGKS